MKKTILYIGNFAFPSGNASGKRVYANGKILKDLGYNVIFIGMDKEISKQTSLKDTEKFFDGFTYYNFSYPEKNLEWLNYLTVFKSLRHFLEEERIIDDTCFVITYGSIRISLLNFKMANYFKTKNIKLIVDVVDWLTIKTDSFIFDFVKRADNKFKRDYLNKRADGIIAISTYLENYYKKGSKTLLLPPLASNYYSEEIKNEGNQKKIIYAGTPFRKGQELKNFSYLKDRIDVAIELLYQAKKKNFNFIFNIYGFTKEEYLTALPKQKIYVDDLANNICFHGLKDNSEVVKSLMNSDFSILYRDVNRDTTAGFPTKISESINLGVPVITTKTSDLKNYIVEGKNGFFLDLEDELLRQQQIETILNLNEEKVYLMKKYCIENKVFYYKKYEKTTKDFLEMLI